MNGAWKYWVRTDTIFREGTKLWFRENQLEQIEPLKGSTVKVDIGDDNSGVEATIMKVEIVDGENELEYHASFNQQAVVSGDEILE